MRTIELNIPANGTYPFAISGTFVRVNSTSGPFSLTIGEDRLDMVEGDWCRLPQPYGGPGRELTVTNDSAAELVMELVLGDGGFGGIDARTSASPSTVTDAADQTIAATSTAEIAAANASRVEVVVTSLASNAETLRIGSATAGAGQGVPLAPGQSLILTTRAALFAYNPGAAGQSVSVAELEV